MKTRTATKSASSKRLNEGFIEILDEMIDILTKQGGISELGVTNQHKKPL